MFRRAKTHLPTCALLLVLLLAASLVVRADQAQSPEPVSAGSTTQFYAVGDSITNGGYLMWPAMQSWPNRASTRMFGEENRTQTHVVAHGGQCLVATICGYGPPLVSTWMAEVVNATPKPTTVVVAIGRNDLYHVTDTQMVNAYSYLVSTAQNAGIRVIVMTIVPAASSYQWYSYTEPQRVRVNNLIRSTFGQDVADAEASIGSLDGVVYDSGDHIHPAWPAHVVMADTIPLSRVI